MILWYWLVECLIFVFSIIYLPKNGFLFVFVFLLVFFTFFFSASINKFMYKCMALLFGSLEDRYRLTFFSLINGVQNLNKHFTEHGWRSFCCCFFCYITWIAFWNNIKLKENEFSFECEKLCSFYIPDVKISYQVVKFIASI